MKLKNRFNEEDKARVWLDHPYCAVCGSNQMCSLHHIFGTKTDDIKTSIMLCAHHHSVFDGINVKDGAKGKELQQWALKYTADWIEQQSCDIII